jgi:hypothetical protein
MPSPNRGVVFAWWARTVECLSASRTYGREERSRLSAFAWRNRSAPKQAAAARAPRTTKTAKPPGYASPGKGCVLSADGDTARGGEAGAAGRAAEDRPRRTAGTTDSRAAAAAGCGESGPAPRATDGATRETSSGTEGTDVAGDPAKVTSEVITGEPAATFVTRNFVTGDVVAGGVVTGEVTGTVVAGGVVTGEVSGTVVTGKVSGTVVTGEVSGTVVTGKVSGTVVTGNVSGTVVTGKVSGTVVTGKVTGGKVSGGKVTGAALCV